MVLHSTNSEGCSCMEEMQEQDQTTGYESSPEQSDYAEFDYDLLANTIYDRFEAGRAEKGTFVELPSGEVLHVAHSADLGSLLMAVLLFALIAIQSCKWLVDTIRK